MAAGATDDLERRPPVRTAATVIAVLIAIVIGFFVHRLIVDSHNIAAQPAGLPATDRQFAHHPVIAYLHIIPGMIYLLGAPLQLSHRFRSRHYPVHRAMGRVILPAGIVTGVFAIIFGIPFAVGGPWEGAATVVFGLWFLYCLVCAYLAIRRGDITTHRRFMIRAFAVGVGIGTIRIIIGALAGPGFTSYQIGFSTAFWVAFSLHALVGEWWVRRYPVPEHAAHHVRAAD